MADTSHPNLLLHVSVGYESKPKMFVGPHLFWNTMWITWLPPSDFWCFAGSPFHVWPYNCCVLDSTILAMQHFFVLSYIALFLQKQLYWWAKSPPDSSMNWSKHNWHLSKVLFLNKVLSIFVCGREDTI